MIASVFEGKKQIPPKIENSGPNALTNGPRI